MNGPRNQVAGSPEVASEALTHTGTEDSHPKCWIAPAQGQLGSTSPPKSVHTGWTFLLDWTALGQHLRPKASKILHSTGLQNF